MAIKCCSAPTFIVGVFVLIYFAIFPDDILWLFGPLQALAQALAVPAATVLGASEQASPWLYVTVVSLILARAATSIWGPAAKPAPKPTTRKKTKATG